MTWLETVRSNLSPLTFNLILTLVIVTFTISLAWMARGLVPSVGDRLASYWNGKHWNSRQPETAPSQKVDATAEANLTPLAQDEMSREDNAGAAGTIAPNVQGDTEPVQVGDAQLALSETPAETPPARLPAWGDSALIRNTPRLSARPVMGKRTTGDFP